MPSEAEGMAEGLEERRRTKENSSRQNSSRAQSRKELHSALGRIRELASKDKEVQFVTLWHHVYSIDRLREAYLCLKRKACPGVDGVTWRAYRENLEENLQALSDVLRRGAYRVKAVRRSYIRKEDGSSRPLGVTSLEDKIVQRCMTEVMNAVYETDFLGFSYGFRAGRSQHMALDALAVGIQGQKVNWVLDTDIRGFFNAISHE